MTDISNHYSYKVQWSEDDGEYVGTCLELPGLSWLEESAVDTLIGIQNVASEVVQDMLEHGEEPPVPFTDREYSGKFLVRTTPERHRQLAMEAAEQHVSMNKLIDHKLSV